MMMRRRGPGLVRTVARTAVIAGTATAVSGAVVGHQQKKAQEQAAEAQADQAAFQSQQDVAEMQAQMAAMQAQQAASAAPPPAPAAAAPDLTAELQKLASLKEAGLLTDEEFAAAKAKLLG
jgi:hypothetical protein